MPLFTYFITSSQQEIVMSYISSHVSLQMLIFSTYSDPPTRTYLEFCTEIIGGA